MSDRLESSKKAAKRAKRDRLSIQAALRSDPNSGIHISEGRSDDDTLNTRPQDDHNSSREDSQASKKKRGPNRCNTMATESGKRVKVNFNKKGQPIEEESVKLSSFLGALGRDMVPITYDDWRPVPQEKKNYIWEVTSQKFILDEGESKRLILQMIGRLWRAYKSRLMASIEECEKEQDLIEIKPDNIDSVQWETFIKQRSSKKFREKRKKFKGMRAEQILPHTCSRKGYARLENDMKKDSPNPSSITRVDVWTRSHTKKSGELCKIVVEQLKKIQDINQLPLSSSSSLSLRDDALSQVLGPERRGRVRSVGFGVTPSKLGIVSQNTSKIAQLEQKIKQMESVYEQRIQPMENLIKQLQDNQGHGSGNEHVSQTHTTTSQSIKNEKESQTRHTSTSQTQRETNKRGGDKCKLKNWIMPNDIVVEVRWVTDDPNALVHFVPLGPNASKVWVDEAIQPSALLWRSTADMSSIGDAVGSTISWPTDHIIMVED